MSEAALTRDASHFSPAYARVEELIAAERCVVLDGAVATELQRQHDLHAEGPGSDRELWGTWALYRAPDAVLDVHRALRRARAAT